MTLLNGDDRRRLQFCWMVSAAMHAAAGVALLRWHHEHTASRVILTEVEFREPEALKRPAPAPPAEIASPLKALKNIFENAFSPPKAQAPEEAPAPVPLPAPLQEPRSVAAIDLKTGPVAVAPGLRLDHSTTKSARLEEAPGTSPLNRVLSAAPPLEAPIHLEEVGRIAVPKRVAEAAEALALKQAAMRPGLIDRGQDFADSSSRPTSTRGPEEAPIELAQAGARPVGFSAAARDNAEARENRPIAVGETAAAVPAGRIARLAAPAESPTPRALSAQDSPADALQKSVQISGPISGRKVLKFQLPAFPDWARRESIQADVTLEFYVTPEGAVTQDIRIQRTSGHKELDQKATQALRLWIFEPIKSGTNQWGLITFRYILE